jgi:hypothetical protein
VTERLIRDAGYDPVHVGGFEQARPLVASRIRTGAVGTAPHGRSSSTAVRVYETRWVGARVTLEGWADAVWVVSARTSDEAGEHRDDLLARCLRCGADPDLLAAPEHADSVGESEHLVE